MASRFQKATREQLKLRMAIDGPSGSGKTFTALLCALALGEKVAVIDSENRSALKYQGLEVDGIKFDFFHCGLTNYAPTEYAAAIRDAGREGFDVIVVDSLSHAWAGEGGALELKDAKGGNSFTAWKEITPMHNRLVESILKSPAHVIATMRCKTAYVLEQDERGRSVPRKIGMEPVQRAGVEYEFDIVADMDWTHTLKVSKSRCPDVDGLVVVKPGPNVMLPIIEWLNVGVRPELAGKTAPAVRRPIQQGTLATLKACYEDLKRHGVGQEVWKALLAPFGVSSASDLTEDDGEEFKGKVFEKLAEASQAKAAEVKAKQADEEAAAKANGNGKAEEPKATREQVETIDGLLGSLKIDADKALAGLQRWYGIHGLGIDKAFFQLTTSQADDLIKRLNAKRGEVATK